MNNMSSVKASLLGRRALLGVIATGLGSGLATAASTKPESSNGSTTMTNLQSTHPLTASELSIGPAAAATAVGDMPALTAALSSALDAGLSVNELKEVLVQLYAYAGFPRSLNALGSLMNVLKERKANGIQDKEGALPGPVPPAQDMLEVGTANQTKLAGAPVVGPLFTFAPAIDQYLKTHLFGDIFVRDNLSWISRELATVAALGALTGVESQLKAHIGISRNVGLTDAQLSQFAEELGKSGAREAATRIKAAIAS